MLLFEHHDFLLNTRKLQRQFSGFLFSVPSYLRGFGSSLGIVCQLRFCIGIFGETAGIPGFSSGLFCLVKLHPLAGLKSRLVGILGDGEFITFFIGSLERFLNRIETLPIGISLHRAIYSACIFQLVPPLQSELLIRFLALDELLSCDALTIAPCLVALSANTSNDLLIRSHALCGALFRRRSRSLSIADACLEDALTQGLGFQGTLHGLGLAFAVNARFAAIVFGIDALTLLVGLRHGQLGLSFDLQLRLRCRLLSLGQFVLIGQRLTDVALLLVP